MTLSRDLITFGAPKPKTRRGRSRSTKWDKVFNVIRMLDSEDAAKHSVNIGPLEYSEAQSLATAVRREFKDDYKAKNLLVVTSRLSPEDQDDTGQVWIGLPVAAEATETEFGNDSDDDDSDEDDSDEDES